MNRWIARACLALLLAPALCAAAGADTNVPPTEFDLWCAELDAQPEARTGLLFSPLVGGELDTEERDRYGVFGRTRGFISARLPVDRKGRAQLELTLQGLADRYDVKRRCSPATLRLTRLHFYLCEKYFALPPLGERPTVEAEVLWHLALRFAATGRYDLCEGVLEEIHTAHGDTGAGREAAHLLPNVRALRRDQQVAVWDFPARQGEGSNDLKLFGAYYGLWLGLAVPLAFESESPEAYGAGLILGGPLGFTTAAWASRRWDISEGDATMIELGGDLGTWQGLGWAAQGDGDTGTVVSSGVLSGLAGIGAASWLTSKYEFTEGHAALTGAAMPWGAWFGLVAAVISETDDSEGWDDHKSMMIGADALVLTTGVLARGVQMSEKRVRMITMAGVVGSVMGLGFDLVFQPDDGGAAMGIVGACGAMGLAAGFHVTRDVDGDRWADAGNDELRVAGRTDFHFPQISVQPNLMTGRGAMPAVGAGFTF